MADPVATSADWLRANPPAPGRFTATLAGVAARTGNGEDFRYAVREFLDEFALRADAIAQAPAAFRRRGVFVPARSLRRV